MRERFGREVKPDTVRGIGLGAAAVVAVGAALTSYEVLRHPEAGSCPRTVDYPSNEFSEQGWSIPVYVGGYEMNVAKWLKFDTGRLQSVVELPREAQPNTYRASADDPTTSINVPASDTRPAITVTFDDRAKSFTVTC